MGYARIRISGDLLREWMPLPLTASIVGSVASEEPGAVEIVVEDQALPELTIGEKPPLICPTFRKNLPVEFVDWGLP
jgi:hypothetical protein